MNTPKWMVKQDNEIIKMFDQTRHIERELRVFGKKFVTDINLDLPDYYVSTYTIRLELGSAHNCGSNSHQVVQKMCFSVTDRFAGVEKNYLKKGINFPSRKFFSHEPQI
jgi:hypothetical protein